jgi:putative Mg2+ transporter-C (MgtC) family protein
MADELEIILRLVMAVVLGSVIGIQRSQAHKSAGLRDMGLLSLGSALFTVLSIYGFGGEEPARIGAGVVTGVGFLGAGAIFRTNQDVVKGITTATTIWVTAGIGMACGAGMYYLAPVATLLVLLLLVLRQWLGREEKNMDKPG